MRTVEAVSYRKAFCWNTAGMPTVADNKKMAENEFVANLSELSIGTLYYVRAFAEKSLWIAYSEELAVRNSSPFLRWVR